MYKNIIIGFLVTACIVGYLSIGRNTSTDEKYENTIDSIQAVLNDQKIQVVEYKAVAKILTHEQDVYVQRADSLQKLLDKPLPCPEENRLLKEQVVELRNGLAKCSKVTTVQTKTIGIQDEIIGGKIHIVDIKNKQIHLCEKQSKKGKFKAFFIGLGAGIVATAVLILS